MLTHIYLEQLQELQSAVEMSDAENHENTIDEFVFQESLTIMNHKLKLNLIIHAKFLCASDGVRFLNVDQYRSRGVYKLLTCKVDVEGVSPVAIKLSRTSATTCVQRGNVLFENRSCSVVPIKV